MTLLLNSSDLSTYAKLKSLRMVVQRIDPTIEILKLSTDGQSVKVRLPNRSEGWMEVRTLFVVPPKSVAPQRE